MYVNNKHNAIGASRIRLTFHSKDRSLERLGIESDQQLRTMAASARNKGYNIENITPEQDRDIFNIIAPILDEYLNTELDIETKVLSWDDLCNGILNLDENEKLSVDDKARITQYLCKDEL